MAMIGDGKTEYNHANDGKDQELAGCSVSALIVTAFVILRRLILPIRLAVYEAPV